MIMIAVNNSTGSTGSMRVSCTGRENKENQMGCLGAGWQGKKEKEACNGEKPTQQLGHSAGTQDIDSPCSCLELGRVAFKLWSCSGALPGKTIWRRRASETTQARPGADQDLRKLL